MLASTDYSSRSFFGQSREALSQPNIVSLLEAGVTPKALRSAGLRASRCGRRTAGGGGAAGVLHGSGRGRGGAVGCWRRDGARPGRISAAWAGSGQRGAGGGALSSAASASGRRRRRGGADVYLPFGAAARDVL